MEENLKSELLRIKASLFTKLNAFEEAYKFIVLSSKLIIKFDDYLLSFECDGESLELFDDLYRSYKNLIRSIEIDRISPDGYYLSLLFIDLISSTELFFIDLIKIALKKDPKKVGGTKFTLKEIIDVSTDNEIISINELVSKASESFINNLLYKKPKEYLSELCGILSINENLINSYWPSYVEAKARRDLGVHNNWRCNSIYIRKVKEVGMSIENEIGDLMFPEFDGYADKLRSNIYSLTLKIFKGFTEKHFPELKI